MTPQPKPEEPKDPAFNIPAKTLGDAQQMTPGMLESAMAASMISTGTGSEGGAGTGKGTGIGPGKGSGLGPGEGGGTGGGVYRPGNGVELPQVVVQEKPQYTAEAMRAKVQGVVWVDASCCPTAPSAKRTSRSRSTRSSASIRKPLKAAKQWRFIPAAASASPWPSWSPSN